MHADEAPGPFRILDALNSFQRTFALEAAIELDLFSHIAAGATRVSQIAERAGASHKGVRVLCDYLTVAGFLEKEADGYRLPPDVAMFLDSRSPAYVGGAVFFLAHPRNVALFADLASAVRKGGTASGAGNLDPEASIWVEFARWMAPLAAILAARVAKVVDRPGDPLKVLDVAAGHGEYGIALARANPLADIHAQDWPSVLALARERATAAGVIDRYHTRPGSAFEVDLGSGYDVILLPNFIHHFDHAVNVGLLTRLRAALAPGGRLATIEFVPNDDRVSPPAAAAFGLTMLASTAGGDAYTLGELEAMFREAGFGPSRAEAIGPQMLVVTER
jgi:2-polyprenyl-3-methyl-5-hydroxy-6-metoxy-1,4-benzoquinol methylase